MRMTGSVHPPPAPAGVAIFQLVHLARPNRIIHENEDDCDLDMTEWQDDMPEGGNHDDDIDPRWEALKGLDN